MEDAERLIQGGIEPEKLTISIAIEDPDNPDEKALETARRIRALGAKVQFTQAGTHHIFFGNTPFREWYARRTQEEPGGEEDE